MCNNAEQYVNNIEQSGQQNIVQCCFIMPEQVVRFLLKNDIDYTDKNEQPSSEQLDYVVFNACI